MRKTAYALFGVGGVALLVGLGSTVTGQSEPSPGAEPAQAAAPPNGGPQLPLPPGQQAGPQPQHPPANRPPAPPPQPAPSPHQPSTPRQPAPQPDQPSTPVPPPAGPSDSVQPPAAPSHSDQQHSAPDQHTGGTAPLRDEPVRIYNNGTIKGLAERAAQEFRDRGYQVVEVGNYARGRMPHTAVYYRPGTPEKAQAEDMARQLGVSAEPRFPGLANQPTDNGVILLLTNDYRGM